MSGILNDQGRAPRRYRLAGDATSGVASDHHAHVDDLVAGYALGALDGDERSVVERHRRICAACAELVERECRVVAMLPMAVPPAQPAPDVKVALFARIAQTQRAAVEADVPTGRTRDLPPTVTIPASRPILRVEAPALAAPAPWSEAPSGRRSWLGRTASFASVPLLLALFATGAWGFQMRDEAARTSGEVNTLQASLANFGAENALPLYAKPGSTSAGALLVGTDQRQGMVKMLLDPDPSREYRLVALDADGKMVPVADLDVDDQGNSQLFSFAQPFDSYQKVQVRAEAVTGGGVETVPFLSGDVNASILSSDGTSNNAAP